MEKGVRPSHHPFLPSSPWQAYVVQAMKSLKRKEMVPGSKEQTCSVGPAHPKSLRSGPRIILSVIIPFSYLGKLGSDDAM